MLIFKAFLHFFRGIDWTTTQNQMDINERWEYLLLICYSIFYKIILF